ncbi:MAG: hypothetical protein CL610_21615 [Anaerolineaceae bacterium]|nr:hypothetical protein [Anaerolineaceae bacterium]
MATTARTWFYTTPEPRPYYIEERVNHTLWNNRLQTLSMVCTQAVPPIKMEGNWQGNAITFEWQPGQWFTLRMAQENRELIGVLRQMLMMRPALTYDDAEGMTVIEWHTDGGGERWRTIQGQPGFQGLRRLRKD